MAPSERSLLATPARLIPLYQNCRRCAYALRIFRIIQVPPQYFRPPTESLCVSTVAMVAAGLNNKQKEVVVRTIETRRCEMLGRVREFGEQYGHLLPKASEAGEAFAAVAAALREVGDHTRSKLSSETVPKGERALARDALREYLDAMVRAARIIGETTPGFENNFELPDDANDQELVAAGRLFADNAQGVRKRFVAHAFPAAFLADLTAFVDRFEQAVRDRNAGQVKTVDATVGIDSAIESGLAAVRKLDVMLRVALKDKKALLQVWNKARRVVYRNRVRQSAPVPPAPVEVTPPEPVATAPQPASIPPVVATDTPAPIAAPADAPPESAPPTTMPPETSLPAATQPGAKAA